MTEKEKKRKKLMRDNKNRKDRTVAVGASAVLPPRPNYPDLYKFSPPHKLLVIFSTLLTKVHGSVGGEGAILSTRSPVMEQSLTIRLINFNRSN